MFCTRSLHRSLLLFPRISQLLGLQQRSEEKRTKAQESKARSSHCGRLVTSNSSSGTPLTPKQKTTEVKEDQIRRVYVRGSILSSRPAPVVLSPARGAVQQPSFGICIDNLGRILPPPTLSSSSSVPPIPFTNTGSSSPQLKLVDVMKEEEHTYQCGGGTQRFAAAIGLAGRTRKDDKAGGTQSAGPSVRQEELDCTKSAVQATQTSSDFMTHRFRLRQRRKNDEIVHVRPAFPAISSSTCLLASLSYF